MQHEPLGRRVDSAFQAPFWLRSPHLQTVWGPKVRRPSSPARQMEKYSLADGDHLWLTWAGPPLVPGAACVLILHGLSGCADSHYAVSLQHQFASLGVSSVVMNCRGAGGRHNDTALGYHAGEVDDLGEVIAYISQRTAGGPVLPVGVSLGGSRLLNWLASHHHAAVVAAAAVSVPLELDRCSTRLDQGMAVLYRNNFMRTLLPEWQQKHDHLLQHAPNQAARIRALGDLSGIRSFWQYDEQIIAPLYGFGSARAYYQQCSVRPRLRHIETPTLILHAADDPFMTPDVIPASSELGAGVVFELAHTGGHVGFVYGVPHRPRYYIDERIPDWFEPWL